MKVKFEYTLKDYKKYLIRSRRNNNIIIFLIGLLVYLFLTINKVSLLFLPLFIIGLFLLIFLLNIVYVNLYMKVNKMMNASMYGKYLLELTPNKFSVTINNSKVDYKYKNIKKIIEKKDYFKIKFKNSREYLTFEKDKIIPEEYEKTLEYFKSKTKDS